MGFPQLSCVNGRKKWKYRELFLAEKSDDGQKTWKIIWDSVYVKGGTSSPAKK